MDEHVYMHYKYMNLKVEFMNMSSCLNLYHRVF